MLYSNPELIKMWTFLELWICVYLSQSFSRITANVTYRCIVVFKGAAGALGQPGPEGTEGPKVSVDTKFACFLYKINLAHIEILSS